MKTTRFLTTVLILLSLVPQAFTASPAVNPALPNSIQAHPPVTLVTLTVVNNTGGMVSFIMDGSSKTRESLIYKYFGLGGRNVYKVEQGNYVVTFWACHRQVAKLLRITGSRNVILECRANLTVH